MITEIKIRCRFSEYEHLVCDTSGQFWILPHQSGKKFIPIRKVTPVVHMNSPHINYKSYRVSIKSLREREVLVKEIFKVDKKKLPF
jgi:hypothetical protein